MELNDHGGFLVFMNTYHRYQPILNGQKKWRNVNITSNHKFIIKCQGSFFSYFIVRLKSETTVHPLCITNIISYLMWSQNDAKKDDVWNIPIATYFIVTVCKVLLAASMWMNEWKFEPMSENPTLGPSAQVLIKLGAKDTDLIVNNGEYYRLVTAMFLHAGLVHWVIELAHGSFALFILFVIPAIGGTILFFRNN